MGTDATHNTNHLTMPPAEDIAVQAIAELVAEGYTSSVMKLSRPVLNELGRRLTEPGEEIHVAAVTWLKGKGHDLKRSSVYRFAQRYREKYKTVWAGWANKLVLLRRAGGTEQESDDLVELIRDQTRLLVAQEVMTHDAGELDTKRIGMYLKLVENADSAANDRAKLDLARRQAEDRAAKLEAEVERIKREQERKDAKIEERLKALGATVDGLSNRVQRGQSIDPSVFAQIRDELMGVQT